MSALSNNGHASLLALVQTACREIGLTPPVTVFGNVDLNVQLLLSLAQREARMLMQRGAPVGGWQVLRTEYAFGVQSTGTFTGSTTAGSNVVTLASVPATAPQVGWVLSNASSANAAAFSYPTVVLAVNGSHVTVSQAATISGSSAAMAFGQDTYPFPADVDHLIPQTFWDRTFRWQMLGPLDPQEWQVLKSGISPTGPRRRFRIAGGNFCIDPVPSDNNTLVYEYYSVNCCRSAGGVGQSAFAADSDVFLIDDDALVMGLVWRYRRSKGFAYDTEMAEYEMHVQRLLARQATARNLPLNASGSGVRLLNTQNVPDTGFGS
jgi:hypothetical protein